MVVVALLAVMALGFLVRLVLAFIVAFLALIIAPFSGVPFLQELTYWNWWALSILLALMIPVSTNLSSSS